MMTLAVVSAIEKVTWKQSGFGSKEIFCSVISHALLWWSWWLWGLWRHFCGENSELQCNIYSFSKMTCGWVLVPSNGQCHGLENQRIVSARNPHMTLKTVSGWPSQIKQFLHSRSSSMFCMDFYVLLDDILWQGWSEQCIISGDQSISAGPFKRVKYERSSRSREIFWCKIKSRKFLQQIFSSYIRVLNYSKLSHYLHVQKIPSDMEIAPRYKLPPHCVHYLHRLHCLYCLQCLQ